ncbi:cytochrome c-type biogenesis protein [Thermosyntropha lipolytica DSM 11003]|uniref:Cytochrome c-type biogenesis protein n=1 Tax=Thermosyntropha lipolytica DSM 11003 TaxID=1123382 RepID=A0A1M5RJ99_9FIRM|nr:cytochrome c biogenesis protein CcdA [Thermosyntropha lipolytica]SHH26188.1 cytochrome c-type biogenesis protein [Thermosyntropha lipolytica DSM 11003]
MAGIITSIGPCNLSMVPIIIGYVGGQEASRRQSFVISLFFTLGTATTFMLLGLFIAAAGGIFGVKKMIIYYLVAGVCIILGLNLMGILKFNINYGSSLWRYTDRAKGLSGSYLLGLVMGLVGSQCGTPVLLVILSLALASGKWLYGATLLFIYALGRGVPLVIAGTFTGLLTRMDVFARWNNILEKVAGLIIVIMGGYFAWLA